VCVWDSLERGFGGVRLELVSLWCVFVVCVCVCLWGGQFGTGLGSEIGDGVFVVCVCCVCVCFCGEGTVWNGFGELVWTWWLCGVFVCVCVWCVWGDILERVWGSECAAGGFVICVWDSLERVCGIECGTGGFVLCVCVCFCVCGTVWNVFGGVSVQQVFCVCVCVWNSLERVWGCECAAGICVCVCLCVCVGQFGTCLGE